MKELDVDVFRIEAEDKKDARKNFSKDWTARIMGIAVIGGFLGYVFLVTLQPPEQNSEALINLVLGYLGGLASAIVSFYFGASNTQKDDS
jgi:UDP-N-acetylmuramyl pentapeptide phosphotransferase/UDP-N-acetylglucosamine-1-phosphate transferase